jgi:hypothetical protein
MRFRSAGAVLCAAGIAALVQGCDPDPSVKDETDVREALDRTGFDYELDEADVPNADESFTGTLTNDDGVSIEFAVSLCDSQPCPTAPLPLNEFAGGCAGYSWSSNGVARRSGDDLAKRQERLEMAYELDGEMSPDSCGTA